MSFGIGQVERDYRPLPDLALDPHVTGRLPGEAVDHAQPETGAATRLLGREQGLEGSLQNFRRHAMAGIRDRHHDERVSGRPGISVPALACGRDGERAAAGHGVARIEGEVQKRILQMGGVDPCLTAILGEPRLEPDVLAQGVAQQLPGGANDGVDIDQPGRDSYRLREAGARRVLLSSPKRWALMHELGGDPEVPLDQLLGEAAGFDLVLVEGYKREPFPKIEIRRDGGASRQPLAGSAPQIVAIASDRPGEETDGLPVFHLDDIGGMANFIAAHLGLGAAYR